MGVRGVQPHLMITMDQQHGSRNESCMSNGEAKPQPVNPCVS